MKRAINVISDIPNEEVMIALICAGEKSYFHDLIRPYARIMFASAQAVLRDPADAEDAVQEAALKAFLHLAQLEDRGRFRAWLLQIVVNEARMHRRKLRRQLYESIDETDEGDDGDSMPRQFADWHDLPDEALDRNQLRDAVRNAVDKLPEAYREVLLLIDSQHLSYADVAEALGVSVGAVKTRVHRARMRVQEQLGPAFQPRFSDHIRLMKGMNPWSHAKS
ncbi:MAG: sigma-70 family RNA polymerase sigma factor [Acidobacteriota bacterium]|nr:sigma-70 family RNA polymerase sigma factor [Acidobacteriota bacterium]